MIVEICVAATANLMWLQTKDESELPKQEWWMKRWKKRKAGEEEQKR
jgi:hypothetical protein